MRTPAHSPSPFRPVLSHLLVEHVIEHAEVDAPLQALGQVLLPRSCPHAAATAAAEERQGQRELEDPFVQHRDQVVLLAHDSAVFVGVWGITWFCGGHYPLSSTSHCIVPIR